MAGDLTLNKFAGAILATALGVMLIKEVSHSAIHPHKQENGFVYMSAVKPGDTPVVKEEIEQPFPQASWVAEMDAEKGEKYFLVCKTCHAVEAGPSKLTGPNLWNIVGRPSGSIDGFGYSGGMSGMNITWGYEELDTFLQNPKKYVKGTSMGFAGEGKEKKRAAIIEYLRTLSDNPQPRPEPVAAIVPADDMVEDMSAPTEGEAPKAIEVLEGGPESINDETINDESITEDTITDKAGNMAEDVADSATDVTTDIVEGAEAAVKGVTEKAADVVDAVEGEAGDLLDKVEDAVDDKAKDLMTSDE